MRGVLNVPSQVFGSIHTGVCRCKPHRAGLRLPPLSHCQSCCCSCPPPHLPAGVKREGRASLGALAVQSQESERFLVLWVSGARLGSPGAAVEPRVAVAAQSSPEPRARIARCEQCRQHRCPQQHPIWREKGGRSN